MRFLDRNQILHSSHEGCIDKLFSFASTPDPNEQNLSCEARKRNVALDAVEGRTAGTLVA